MKRFLPAFFFLIIAAPAAGQSFLPADDLVQDALNSYPAMTASRDEISAARSEAMGLRASPYEWTLSGGYTQRVIDNQFGFNEFDAQITKGIRRRGKSRLDGEIGALGIEAAQLSSADTRHQIALELATLWIEWLSKEEIHVINQAQVDALAASLEIVSKRLANDDASYLELELAQSALFEAKSAAANSLGDAQIAKAMLDSMFPDLPLPQHPPQLFAPDALAEPSAWIEKIISRSHETELAKTQADFASARAKRSRLDLKPDPEVGLRTFSERNGDEVGLGVVVSIPLGGPRRSASADRDAARASAAMGAFVLKQRELRAAARKDVTLAQSTRLTWQQASSARQSSEAAIARVRRGYELRDTDLSDLLVAERRHIETRKLEAIARAQSAFAYVKLRIDSHELWIGHGADYANDAAETHTGH
tara:strand:- start:25242 stop:26507 length:1266 start_codon:yes stop_codon:yes gene_type:complete